MASKHIFLFLLLTAGLFGAAAAQSVSFNAQAQGNCVQGSTCTSNTAMNSTLAGNNQQQNYRDWFSFAPTASGTLSSAVLEIYSLSNNSYGNSPNEVFSLYAPSSVTYSGLVGTGPSLGSVTAAQADTGSSHYVAITLNAAGLNYINSNLGKSVMLGGAIDSGSAQFFGYPYAGSPAQLVLNSSVTPVPEPHPYAFLLGGLGLMGLIRRRRLHRRVHWY